MSANMNEEFDGIENNKFRIGSVSRLTGIPTDTLRIWERRYQVVTPERSESGTRYYSHSDITRLALIKELVEEGNAISTVANLSKQELEQRVSLIKSSTKSTNVVEMAKSCKLIVCGDALPLFMRNTHEDFPEIEVVAEYKNPFQAEAELPDIDADVLLMEFPAFQDQDIGPLQTILKRHPNLYPILVYGFATRSTIELLNKLHISTIRAPLDVFRLRSECQKALNNSNSTFAVSQMESEELNVIPKRRFTQEQIMNLMNKPQPNSVNCECPKHHGDILYNLYAFEDYTVGCQTNNSDEAALHCYIHDCTVKARYMMEQALTKLIEIDNLDIN